MGNINVRDLTFEAAEIQPLDILALAAHPDDVEQTCGGTMLKMAEKGYRTGILDLTAGDMGTRGTPGTRIKESEGAGVILTTTETIAFEWLGGANHPKFKDVSSLIQNRMQSLKD